MEDGLRDNNPRNLVYFVDGLNPCCYGRWSQSVLAVGPQVQGRGVLILVVMEDGLRELYSRKKEEICGVLILVVMEDGLRALNWWV